MKAAVQCVQARSRVADVNEVPERPERELGARHRVIHCPREGGASRGGRVWRCRVGCVTEHRQPVVSRDVKRRCRPWSSPADYSSSSDEVRDVQHARLHHLDHMSYVHPTLTNKKAFHNAKSTPPGACIILSVRR